MATTENQEVPGEEQSYSDDELDDLRAVNDEVIEGVDAEEDEGEAEEASGSHSDEEASADDEVRLPRVSKQRRIVAKGV